MKILFVYPKYPDSFWSFKYALKFISKKASFPPLSLLTVAAMLPAEWDKKLVDMNTGRLGDKDIRQADYVFISAMDIQGDSAKEVIKRCNDAGKKVVAGGPFFTTQYKDISGVDHFVLDEGEVTIPLFLKDLENGCPKPIYTSDHKPDMSLTPLPMWSLINKKHYSSMNIQYSRGCPFNCEFCEIVSLYGRVPRTKTTQQMIAELDTLYTEGWRGGVFVVDDNFIGNKNKLKAEVLPAVIEWMKAHKYPFALSTEASINLADDEELMDLMSKAGFNQVFIGVETPNAESLAECDKSQNEKRDMVASIKKVQNHGMEVQGGFIIGFDNDPLTIFNNQINFIQKSGIVTAMVGLLNAPRGSRLYQRLKGENRLREDFTGDNTHCSMNFTPKIQLETLIQGYKHVMDTIYSPKFFNERIKTFLKEYRPVKPLNKVRPNFSQVQALFRTVWTLGVVDKGRKYYWKLFFSTLFRKPRNFPLAISLSVYGYHFRKVAEKHLKLPAIRPLDLEESNRGA
jgi:radical SAM superfamily enzyme YgiQ (UPF0313 family)